MNNIQSNCEQLHSAGVVNIDDLSDEHVQAINSFSTVEIEQLKSAHKNANKGKDRPVGIVF